MDKPAATPAAEDIGHQDGQPPKAATADADGASRQPTVPADVAAAEPAAAELARAGSNPTDPAAGAESPMGPVAAQGESTLRGVSLKVEMLTALVSKMEHLVSSAEAAARSLQVWFETLADM